MAKLVVLTESLKGRSYDLVTVLTTIGRVEDNAFQIAEPSVSSHHCEIHLRGNDVVIKDLNYTNGTFINGNQISGEGVLKPGQTLRLGQIEMRLENGAGAPPAPNAGPAPAPVLPVQPKRRMDHTSPIPTGVSLGDLEKGPMSAGFDTASKAFSKKTNKNSKLFIIVGVVLLAIVLVLVVMALSLNGNK